MKILVTAIGGGGHGDQILKALLMAGEDRYQIYGADVNPDCPQAKLVKKFIQLPVASDARYLSTLLEQCRIHGINAIFHGCEPELLVLSRNREKFEKLGIFIPINASQLIEQCMDKSKTNYILTKLGFEPPKYLEVQTIDNFNEIDWFPVVLKPSLGSGGSADVFIAQSKKELLALASYLDLEDHGTNFIVQEYVGTGEDEYTVGVLHDLDGLYINSIAVKRHLRGGLSVRASVKNKTDKSELGKKLVISSGISQGEIGKFPEVTLQCRKIAEALGSRGPLNIQLRFVGGKVKVFEINPRYSGTTSLRAMVGFNEPDLILRHHLLAETIPRDFVFSEGVILRSLKEDFIQHSTNSSSL